MNIRWNWLIALVPCLIAAACGGTGSSSTPEDGGVCTGKAPFCFGTDDTSCCSATSTGPATCSGGVWTCGTGSAPGCDRSAKCSSPPDAGGPDTPSDALPDQRGSDAADGGTDSHVVDTGTDSPGKGFDCGRLTCGAGDVCVRYQTEGCGSIHGPDGGICPAGTELCAAKCGGSASCCPTTYACTPRPSTCGATLDCTCGQVACDSADAGGIGSSAYRCAMTTGNQVDCNFFAP